MRNEYFTKKLQVYLNDRMRNNNHYSNAQWSGIYSQIQKFIQDGADIHAKTNNGDNILIHCLSNQTKTGFELFKYFLKFDFCIDEKINHTVIFHQLDGHIKNHKHETFDFYPIFNRLKEIGFNVNARDSVNSYSLINYVITQNNALFLKWLIENHAEVNPPLLPIDSTSPLHLAIECCNLAMVEMLVEAGANIDYINSNLPCGMKVMIINPN